MEIKQTKNELPIPAAGVRDGNSIEMLRVWIAENKLHCSINVGMYQNNPRVTEEDAWGKILADTIRHLSNALFDMKYSVDIETTSNRIIKSLLAESKQPTSPASGDFVD